MKRMLSPLLIAGLTWIGITQPIYQETENGHVITCIPPYVSVSKKDNSDAQAVGFIPPYITEKLEAYYKELASGLNRQKLVEQIKADIYRVFTQEMAIINGDWLAMAEGNLLLAYDLQCLYASFNVSSVCAQKVLDYVCAKWDLEPIII